MATFLVSILSLAVIVGIGGMFIFFRSRKLLREQKNYERGLKMVPLLIHLPPLSEDTDSGGRDARDLIDENISKAQVLYNIIASTAKKDFKSKFYGQRHFGFEIVASHGFVHFYAAVPVSLLDLVQQAIVSAYPSARLEEVAEHNLFSPVGRLSGTVGGELILKEEFAYPIATYQDLKRDTMQSFLNSLSTLQKEDGAGIQILMRPAGNDWRKKANSIAGKKRKGEKDTKGAAMVFGVIKDLVTAFNKPPDEKGEDKKDDKQISGLDQSIIDAIEDKTRHPGYEVQIRVVASSNLVQRAQGILNNMVATFSLFDAPGKNGFKYVPAKDIDDFVTGYILRFFPPENSLSILNSVELATIFHFPDQKNIPTSQLERQASKQVDGPRNIPEEGLLLGYNIFRGTKKKIHLSTNDRRRHLYIVGQTGTGKSTFLENLALQDMLSGNGFAFVDPHGDSAEKLLSMVPKERTEDVIYFCPADMDYPLGLNLFEYYAPEQKDFLIQEAINMLYKLYDPQHQGIIGPRYEHWFRNAALTLMSDPQGSTFIDIPKVFTDNKYAKQKLQYVTDQTVLDFWNKEMAQTSDYHKSEVLGWFVSKFGAFLSNEMMRNIIGQTKSSFNLREVMDQKKILLVNLSKGRTGELNSKLLGMIFVMKFQAAAMSRANVPEDQRNDFSLYVDEFQNFSTDSFATILSEARKYHLNLIVANQFTTQLSDEIRDAVIGNVGSIVSFRVGTNDAEFLSKQFQPVFDIDDLQRVPNANAVVRLLIGGIPSQAFSMATLPPLGSPNAQLADALKQLSAAKYGRPKGLVEKEIFERLKTIEDAKPAFGARNTGALPSRAGGPLPGGATAPGPAKPASGSSFLDEWLNKRKAPAGAPAPANPFGTPPSAPPAQAGQSSPFVNGPAPAAFGQPAAAPVSNAFNQPAPLSSSPSPAGSTDFSQILSPGGDRVESTAPTMPGPDASAGPATFMPGQGQPTAAMPSQAPPLPPVGPTEPAQAVSFTPPDPFTNPAAAAAPGLSTSDAVPFTWPPKPATPGGGLPPSGFTPPSPLSPAGSATMRPATLSEPQFAVPPEESGPPMPAPEPSEFHQSDPMAQLLEPLGPPIPTEQPRPPKNQQKPDNQQPGKKQKQGNRQDQRRDQRPPKENDDNQRSENRQPEPPKPTEPTPVQPEPPKPPINNATEGVIHLRDSDDATAHPVGTEDTIYIDQEGNLHLSGDDSKE